MAQLDRAWRYVAVNTAFLAAVSLPPAAVLGQVCWRLFPAVRQTPVGRLLRRAMWFRQPLAGRLPAVDQSGAVVVVLAIPNAATGGLDVTWTMERTGDDDAP